MIDWLASSWFYWSVAGIFAAAGCWLLYRGLLSDRARGRPRCPGCWYDLSGAAPAANAAPTAAGVKLPITCPECGRRTDHARRLLRTRRHRWPLLLGLLVLGLTLYSYEVRHRIIHYDEGWKTALVPSTAYIIGLKQLDKATFEIVEGRCFNRMLPNKGTPQGRGFWAWQQRLYQASLSRVVSSGDPLVREGALHQLLSMAKEDDTALRYFISHLDHEDDGLRLRAMNWAQALEKRMLPGRDAVIARLRDADNGVRQSATWVLSRLGREQFQGMADAELCRVAGLLAAVNGLYGEGTPRDLYLMEMYRRGGEVITKWLREQAGKPTSEWGDRPSVNLETVTILRRLERRPGPLTIEIEPAELRCKAGAMPQLKAIVRNDDPGRLTVGFQRYGDNRGPRPERWRFEVRSADGALMPIQLESMNFGGISNYATLEHGETFEIDLDMGKFVLPLPPGEFRVVVQYHNSRQISRLIEVEDVVVAQCKAVKLVVEP